MDGDENLMQRTTVIRKQVSFITSVVVTRLGDVVRTTDYRLFVADSNPGHSTAWLFLR